MTWVSKQNTKLQGAGSSDSVLSYPLYRLTEFQTIRQCISPRSEQIGLAGFFRMFYIYRYVNRVNHQKK